MITDYYIWPAGAPAPIYQGTIEIPDPPPPPPPPVPVIVVPDGKQIIVDTDEVQPNPGDFKIAST
jgi:hypothetical protein